MGAFEFIQKLDAKGLLEYTDSTGATICGRVPIAVLLETLGKDAKAEDRAQYTTSGEIMGDYTNSVSYLAATFRGEMDQRRPAGGTGTSDDVIGRGQESNCWPWCVRRSGTHWTTSGCPTPRI